MSVPKGKRTLSDMQFYTTAQKLRYEISIFLLKDFGMKQKVRNFDFINKVFHMTYGDYDKLKSYDERKKKDQEVF